MPNARRAYTFAEELALTMQVDGRCPLCGEALFYEKKSHYYKLFEIAHIYPLNPKPDEIEELKGVRRLNPDVNHPDNLIALCRPCHAKFDKPRTAGEYEQLVAKKQRLLQKSLQQELHATFPLESDIRRVVHGLHTENPMADQIDLEYDPKKMIDKFDDTLPKPTRQKIKHAVTDYYHYIRRELMEMERESPTSSQLICTQVRAFYLKQKSLGLSQYESFNNVVEWIRVKTNPRSIDAAEIVASYFVQNCEVFE